MGSRAGQRYRVERQEERAAQRAAAATLTISGRTGAAAACWLGLQRCGQGVRGAQPGGRACSARSARRVVPPRSTQASSAAAHHRSRLCRRPRKGERVGLRRQAGAAEGRQAPGWRCPRASARAQPRLPCKPPPATTSQPQQPCALLQQNGRPARRGAPEWLWLNWECAAWPLLPWSVGPPNEPADCDLGRPKSNLRRLQRA